QQCSADVAPRGVALTASPPCHEAVALPPLAQRERAPRMSDENDGETPPVLDPYGRPAREPPRPATRPIPAVRPARRAGERIWKAVDNGFALLAAPGVGIALWSTSHLLALWSGAVVAVAMLVRYAGLTRIPRVLAGLILVAAAIASPLLPPNEEPGHGWLEPGSFE